MLTSLYLNGLYYCFLSELTCYSVREKYYYSSGSYYPLKVKGKSSLSSSGFTTLLRMEIIGYYDSSSDYWDNLDVRIRAVGHSA